MKVIVLGGDGYLGWPTAMHLSKKGFQVAIVDNMIKRFWEAEMGIEPLAPIRPLNERVRKWKEATGLDIKVYVGDLAKNHRFVYNFLEDFRPDAIVHYAEQPSAPFSMVSREKSVETQVNNVVGTLNLMFAINSVDPNIHMVKLGTMGEYGTPNFDIEEGWLEVTHNGRSDKVLFPKKPQSFYHLSKVHDSANLEFACRIWGARVTDLNQGAVYGIATTETSLDTAFATSFHYDAIFGTVLNRFLCQAAIGKPLTVYGAGGQTRGFLNIIDTIQCVELALLNPANEGEFRVFNQFTEQFSVGQLAEMVQTTVQRAGVTCDIEHIPNPRIEQEKHYYNAKHTALKDLGLQPNLLTQTVLDEMFQEVNRLRSNVVESVLMPDIKWRS